MSSKLNTLDHTIMSVFLNVSAPLSIEVLSRVSETPKFKVIKSVTKLMEQNFVRCRVDDSGVSLYSFVVDSHYFSPVASVAGRGVLKWDDKELKSLVADIDKRAAAENTQ